MKKLLLSLAALFITAAASAQFLQGNERLVKSPLALQNLTTVQPKQMAKTPNKITLADNQRVLGYWTDDALDSYGLGLNTNATLKLGVYFPASMVTKFPGGKVVKIRFGLAEACTVNKVFMIPVTNAGIGSEVISQAPVNKACTAGWTEVEIEAPAELVTDGSTDYIIGYEYVQKSGSYPLGSHPTLGSQSYIYGNLGSGIGWYNMGTDYAFAVQAIVELDAIPENYIIMSNFLTGGLYAQAGNQMEYALTLQNFGSNVPEDYTIGFALDGEEFAVIDSPLALTADEQQTDGILTLPSTIETGEHALSAYFKSVAGEDPADAQTQYAPVFIYQNSVERQKYLIEQATSHSCTYCPLGEAVLNAVAATVPVAWVSVHGNMSQTDPYNFAECNSWNTMMELSGWPSASFNRLDFGEGLLNGIGYQASYAQAAGQYYAQLMQAYSAPAFITIDISAAYNEETRQLDITVDGQAVEDFKLLYGDDAVLTVCLTENGLVGRQLNQGSWVARYNHEHVLRQFVTSYLGKPIEWNGLAYENNYSVTLDASWKTENMNIVAFVTRKLNASGNNLGLMDVNNAEIKTIAEAVATGIHITPATQSTDAIYNIQGQRLAAPTQPGLYIIGGRQVLVK